ncbi:ras guanine nucleotide exchange factor domain-containing protein [Mycena pura]|uniref:Ras guanine nucleotide exchange factor domain-containing protein n=1 Tax=Mycena pura TaxID=153505 RepID=A0AAD6YBK1_9AGAR|nr:ras guanine nucleotide exchange factor domain-containing protein [Mycena pura]
MPPLTIAERERLRKFQKKLLGHDSESIHSDEVDAPSSPRMAKSTALHGLPIMALFPSLKAPTRMLRKMTQLEQLEQMITIVPVFRSCIDSILKSITCGNIFLRTCVVYMLLHDAISSASLKLNQHIAKISSSVPSCTTEDMAEAVNLVEKILNYLVLLHRSAENFYRTTSKPLPDLPDGGVDVESTVSPDQATPSPIVTDDPRPPPSIEDGDKSSSDPLAFDTTVGASSESPGNTSKVLATPRHKNKFIRRLLQMPLESSAAELSGRPILAAITSSLNSSTPSLVRSESLDDKRDNPYVVRQSFLYDCTDPFCPEKRIVMPLPKGDVVAIRLDSNGDIKAASLAALIMLLTSHHAFAVDDICETFFLTFRLFSSPRQVLTALQARWDERPPDTLLTAAQQRVWNQHKRYVHNCLAHLVLAWLDEYWRPADDFCVLGRLRTFVKRFPAAGVVESVISLVWESIERATKEEYIPRLQRAKAVERRGAPPVAPPFKMVLSQEEEYRVNINVFMSCAGRKQFAGQITDLSHTLFCNIDPEGAVARWVTGTPTFFELQKFEEELLFWVAQCILDGKSRSERVQLIEFWLGVATICVELRNFSSASAIFGGLVFSPVERLSLTILQISILSKEQYRKLNGLFDGANNFVVYRRALAEKDLPAVPLMTVLRKDTISANEISGSVALTDDPDAEKRLINFSAFRMLKKVICTMEACLISFKIKPIVVIQDWIRSEIARFPQSEHAALSQKMDVLSCNLEARAPDPIQKGQTWLQTVKGSVESGSFTLHTIPDPNATPTPKAKAIATILSFRIAVK